MARTKGKTGPAGRARFGAAVTDTAFVVVGAVLLISAVAGVEASDIIESRYLYGRTFDDIYSVARSAWERYSKEELEVTREQPHHAMLNVPAPNLKSESSRNEDWLPAGARARLEDEAELGTKRSHSSEYEQESPEATPPPMKMVFFTDYLPSGHDYARKYFLLWQWYMGKIGSLHRSFFNEYSHYSDEEKETFLDAVKLKNHFRPRTEDFPWLAWAQAPYGQIRELTNWCQEKCQEVCEDKWFSEECQIQCAQPDTSETWSSMPTVLRVWPESHWDEIPPICKFVYRSPHQQVSVSAGTRLMRGMARGGAHVIDTVYGDYFTSLKNFLDTLYAQRRGAVFAFSGYQMNGVFAELAAMYMYETYGMRCPTINIGGPGAFDVAVEKHGATPRREYYPWVAQLRAQSDVTPHLGKTVGKVCVVPEDPWVMSKCLAYVDETITTRPVSKMYAEKCAGYYEYISHSSYSIRLDRVVTKLLSYLDEEKIQQAHCVPGARVAYAEDINPAYPYDFANRVRGQIVDDTWSELACEKTDSILAGKGSFACSRGENSGAYTWPLKQMKSLFVNRVLKADKAYFPRQRRDFDALTLHYLEKLGATSVSVACASMVSSGSEQDLTWCACYEVRVPTGPEPVPIPAMDARAIHPKKEQCHEFLSSSSKIVRRPSSPKHKSYSLHKVY